MDIKMYSTQVSGSIDIVSVQSWAEETTKYSLTSSQVTWDHSKKDFSYSYILYNQYERPFAKV